jgi:CubicO group peptidase (beta-lactamase class C family)
MSSSNSVGRRRFDVTFDESRIDSVFAELDQSHFPGAAVGIAINGAPVYRKGFGLANVELPVILSPATRMPIASTTKHFTCLAYLLLCEEGMAGIDDTLSTHLPDLHPVAHGITMRQLMGHISGLRDAQDIATLFNGMAEITAADLLSLYRDMDDVNAAPSTTWIYNNGAYVILGDVIERLSGKPLEDVLRQRIFEPVGMYDTLLRRFDAGFLPNSAALHVSEPNTQFRKAFRSVEGVGQGGIVSTVDDMLRWLAHMRAPVVGTSATWELIKTPQRLANGMSTGYGLGLLSDWYRGIETLSHAGGVRGGSSQMLAMRCAEFDVDIMVNRDDVSAARLGEQIVDACFPDLDPVAESCRRPCASGVFRSPTTGRVICLFDRDGLQVASIDGAELPVAVGDDGILRPRQSRSYTQHSVTLVGRPDRPTAVRLADFGNVDELVAAGPARQADTEAIAGHYRSKSTGTIVTISADGQWLNTAGPFGSMAYRLESLAQDIWQARSRGSISIAAIVSFDDKNRSFRLSTGRSRALRFERID